MGSNEIYPRHWCSGQIGVGRVTVGRLQIDIIGLPLTAFWDHSCDLGFPSNALNTSNERSQPYLLVLRSPIHHYRHRLRAFVEGRVDQEALAIGGDIVGRSDEGRVGCAGLE
jgi:hypothetical protein